MPRKSSFFVLGFIPFYVVGSFVSYMFTPKNDVQEKSDVVTVSFVGDMMFDRYVREQAEKNGYDDIFSKTLPLFLNTDVLLGNLEGPITNFKTVSDWRNVDANHYKFTFATSVAKTLSNVGFNVVFLSNNHILNFGTKGLSQTKQWLTENDVAYVGAPDEAYTPWRYATGTTKIAVYAFDMWYSRDVDKIVSKIKSESNDTFVIVYAHWGDEYEKRPNVGQVKIAHRFIDVGADFVVGSHPHVVQTKEYYNGKWIYYSLGNFVFDQYFSGDVMCGGVVSVSIKPNMSYEVKESFAKLLRDGTTEKSDCGVILQQ